MSCSVFDRARWPVIAVIFSLLALAPAVTWAEDDSFELFGG